MLLNILIKAAVAYISFHLLWRVFRHSRFNLAGPPSTSWLSGNLTQLFNPNTAWDFHHGILKKYGTTVKVMGAMGEPMVLTCDPKALQHLLVKDRLACEVSSTSISSIIFGGGLAVATGEQHRKQRKMLNPLFSTSHLRGMVPLFYEVTNRLRAVLKRKLENGPKEIDMLHWTSRTALELIGQSGMGFSFDSLVDDNDYHPYRSAIENVIPLSTGPLMFFATQFILPWTEKFNFPRVKRFIVEHIPLQRTQGLVHIVDVMRQTSIEIIEKKKKDLMDSDPAVVEEMKSKKDIISILMRANTMASEEDRLPDDEVIAQISALVFAAMDTTSFILARILWLLSEHPDVQEKMRDEIRKVEKNGELSYDQLVSLPYLDAVCRETLRVYPPVNFGRVRELHKDTVLPFSKPILDSTGKEITETFLQKGTKILISLLGANTNPDIWGSDSYEWKPERWLDSLPDTVAGAPGVYSHMMTVLCGSRACIGFQHSQIEMKVVLSVLLASFRFGKSKSKDVVWKMTSIVSPVVESGDGDGDGDGRRRELPLILSLVD
ncbi:hypothetical protein AGABI2DRAFT_179442 [Agaricus bisporus var. bisporus H97]|uniref:hypothetical protein n=1 Tax=Agaricus bisporus var. bisporus (strain H97 / ATCC MYA-4626 / FGSC 10389) TaxID=936046 RepID=UPI00029F79BE|nr:hypothetical protein AGABI2DRAFT_179442 [Agaricus bisporus var. bisporus H97]EKV46013.1 hypothetical protein AGABI2DRAFT_179442 [Agaricus bisporus var. bisporus H97]